MESLDVLRLADIELADGLMVSYFDPERDYAGSIDEDVLAEYREYQPCASVGIMDADDDVVYIPREHLAALAAYLTSVVDALAKEESAKVA